MYLSEIWVSWAYFWGLWSASDDWRVMYEVIRPFQQFDGVLGC